MNYNSLKGSRFIKKLVSSIKKASPREKILFASILFFFFIALLLSVERVSNMFSVRVPVHGGILKEGVISFPKNPTPLFAETNADHDLVALIYSGLMRFDGEGEIIPDLAESYAVSEDGLTYTFKLRDDIYFHDGTPITASDVVFTIKQIQNPAVESPISYAFSGIEASETDASTVVFTLKNPYAGFLEEMTIGIIPKHIWENVVTGSLEFIELSSYPIGSGPFKVTGVQRSEKLGVPTRYALSAFEKYKDRKPYLNSLELSFYPSETELVQALKTGKVTSAPSLSPSSIDKLNIKQNRLITSEMLRVYGLYFNQDNSSVLTEKSVRRAIDEAINRKELVETIFSGYAKPTRTPLPFNTTQDTSYSINSSRKLLEDAGWKVNKKTGIREKDGTTLSFTIKTGESDDLKNTAEFIKQALKPLGFNIIIKTFDINTLNQTVIRERDYEALLFGQAYGRFIDLYPFWHSSNRNDPGLNIAKYTSSDIDEVLLKLRSETDETKRTKYFEDIQDELSDMVPAIFLYTPEFLYVHSPHIHNIKIPPIERSSDRFADVENWYRYSDLVWKIFLKD